MLANAIKLNTHRKLLKTKISLAGLADSLLSMNGSAFIYNSKNCIPIRSPHRIELGWTAIGAADKSIDLSVPALDCRKLFLTV